MLLTNGGTINFEDYNAYGHGAKYMFGRLGIDPTRYHEFKDSEIYNGLQLGLFFCHEQFGEDKLIAGVGKRPWSEILAEAPLSDLARRELEMLFESDQDYLPDLNLEEKKVRLRSMSYETYLRDVVGISDEAISVLKQDSYWAIGNDCLSAWAAASYGEPGTSGLGFESESQEPVYFQFPDGNASIARMLVRDLNPLVAPGNTMEDVVTAKFDYEMLDIESAPVRIRLSSSVINVVHKGDPETAESVAVTYMQDDNRYHVRASNVVLACYHGIIPHICPDLPEWQSKALSLSLKGPLIYANVAVKTGKLFSGSG